MLGFQALGRLALAEPPSGPNITLQPPPIVKRNPPAVVTQT